MIRTGLESAAGAAAGGQAGSYWVGSLTAAAGLGDAVRAALSVTPSNRLRAPETTERRNPTPCMLGRATQERRRAPTSRSGPFVRSASVTAGQLLAERLQRLVRGE